MTSEPSHIPTPELSHRSVTVEDVNTFGEQSTRPDEIPIYDQWALYSSNSYCDNSFEQHFDDSIHYSSTPLDPFCSSQSFPIRTEVERETACPNNVQAFRDNTPPFALFQSDEIQQAEVNEDRTFSMNDVSLGCDGFIAPHIGTMPRTKTPDKEASGKRYVYGLDSCLNIISDKTEAKMTDRYLTPRSNVTGMAVHIVEPLYENVIWFGIKRPFISDQMHTDALWRIVLRLSAAKTV